MEQGGAGGRAFYLDRVFSAKCFCWLSACLDNTERKYRRLGNESLDFLAVGKSQEKNKSTHEQIPLRESVRSSQLLLCAIDL